MKSAFLKAHRDQSTHRWKAMIHTETDELNFSLNAAHLVWVNGHPGSEPYNRYAVESCCVGDRSGRQMIIRLRWMAHQDGVHLWTGSQNRFKYKLPGKTGSQRSDRYDSWIWTHSLTKSINHFTVWQIDWLKMKDLWLDSRVQERQGGICLSYIKMRVCSNDTVYIHLIWIVFISIYWAFEC